MIVTQRLTLLTLGGVVAVGVLSYCAGRREGAEGQQLATDHRATAVAVVAREPIAAAATRAVERVRRAGPTLAAAHSLAAVLNDSTLIVRVLPSDPGTPVATPRPVVARIIQDSLQLGRLSAAVDSLGQLRTADSLVITAQAVEITHLRAAKAPRCGARCGAVLTVAALVGAGVVAKNAGAIVRLFRRK